jgi:hypothetical protein
VLLFVLLYLLSESFNTFLLFFRVTLLLLKNSGCFLCSAALIDHGAADDRQRRKDCKRIFILIALSIETPF